MSKKRRTKEQKIIARLKRQLAHQKTHSVSFQKQEELPQNQIKERNKEQTTGLEKKAVKIEKKSFSDNNELFFYNPSLIKKDLLKTLFFTLVILILIGIFYWGIEFNGIKIIREFFRL